MPNSITYLNPSPIFEWWVVKCGSKNIDQQDMSLKETRLHAQKMLNQSRLKCQYNWWGRGPHGHYISPTF